MNDFTVQPYESCVVEQSPVNPEIARQTRQRVGVIGNTIRYVSCVDWLPRLVMEVADPHFSHMDKDTMLRIAAVSSYANACRYCYGATRAYLQMTGFSDAEITDLQGEINNRQFEPKTAAVLSYARALATMDPMVAPLGEEVLQSGYSPLQLAEITYYTSILSASHRVNGALGVPLDGFQKIPETFLGRMLRPLTKAWASKFGGPRPAPKGQLNIPEDMLFTRAVDALTGSAAVEEFQLILSSALASQSSTIREKGLIYAVVARTWGSTYMEQQACMMLSDAGLPGEVISQSLEHLRHPDLSENEIAIMRYARDSVRQQMTTLQKKLGEIGAGKEKEWIVDFAGQVAIANMVVRICVLVVDS